MYLEEDFEPRVSVGTIRFLGQSAYIQTLVFT